MAHEECISVHEYRLHEAYLIARYRVKHLATNVKPAYA